MTEKDDPNFIERFTVRMPDGMRDAIAGRAKKNGRSMNSEIVQILQDALADEQLNADTERFGRYEEELNISQTLDEKMAYLKKLEEEDPFAAVLLRETEEHNLRLIKLLGEHMEKGNNKKPT
ncbi:Arc family DNA-binding protein [Yersinia enterocolitica]|uniref:Arc family DNA-binding protein n=1 Tax=Yersinia TaxID=629 RepID=UPI0028B4F7B8|nr:Arc family DNA-binding protein [Yersinia enterocolitica]HEN3249971.1 Arc family DNA-binding protein [Yersinia enterocolitica]